MKTYTAENIRNVSILGHGSEGKTTLVEAMLQTAGLIDRMGKTDDGSSAMDYEAEEVRRHISISMAMAPIESNDVKINVLDIPGYFDMAGEMVGALRAVEGAVILANAVSGMSVGLEKAWSACTKHGVAKMIFVNQMDREHTDFVKTLQQIQDKYGPSVTPLQLPIVEGTFKGYVDLLTGKAYHFDGKGLKDTDIPAAMQADCEAMREALVEAVASADEELMEKYFGEGELTEQEMRSGLKAGVATGEIVPVLCGSALQNQNIRALLDAIRELMPSAVRTAPVMAHNTKTDAEVAVETDPNQPFSALVFKTVADNFVGKISYIKVFSGKLSVDMQPLNTTSGKIEKLNKLITLQGKKQIELSSVSAGDIAVLIKLQNTATGDTLSDAATPLKFAPLAFPHPVISFAVTAEKQGEEDKVFSGLYRLEEEDPSFTVQKSTETAETLISGQGELHLDIIISKLKSKFNVSAQLSDPKIPYRETIRKTVQAEGRHKKQTGGHGQFGHCWIRFEPMRDSDQPFEFVDNIVGGVIPKGFIPAIEKGLRDSMLQGVLAGFPVVNIRATVYDGSYHAVDSNELSFRTAARLAFRKGCAEASPVLLEPICRAQITIPDEYMGDIIGDLNRRRGRIMGMNPVDGQQEVVAEVPMAEMFKYATDLRSMTQARGDFTLTFERYEEAPANIAQKVIEAYKREMEDDE